MWVNIFEAESYDEEAQVKVVSSLTLNDLVKLIKQGEIIATEWLHSNSHDADFQVIIRGRRVGAGKGGEIIDMQDGSKLDINRRVVIYSPSGRRLH